MIFLILTYVITIKGEEGGGGREKKVESRWSIEKFSATFERSIYEGKS